MTSRLKLALGKSQLSTPRVLFFGLSVLSTVICAWAAAAHYLKSPWGDLWQPVGWVLSMVFLLLAVRPNPGELATSGKGLITPKAGFFVFWVVFFVVSHLWNFRTAPWNGNALFDESGWDLWYLKTYVMGHAYQPAWFHPPISRETLFHYYVWAFLKLFGFNILSYQAALFVIWLTVFVFSLLLVHLFFESYVVTSATALILNFLPFAFIYTFAGYRYPMATALAVVSLYFLHLGFKTTSRFYLSLSGIAAGLCLASSISGKQYLLALVIAAPFYGAFYWRSLTQKVTWSSVAIVVYGFVAAATPILLYVVFNREQYTLYESNFLRDFLRAAHTGPFPSGIRSYIEQCRSCFFKVPALRFFIPDTLPIPLPYYWFLVPGLALSVWRKRFEIPLLAVIPVAGAFIAKCLDNRLLMPIPFWVILMSFTIAGILQLRKWLGIQIVVGVVATLILLYGLIPSIRYIYTKTNSPFSIRYYAQYEVAVSRFLRHVVAGQEHPDPPRLERDEFNRMKGVSEASYDTLICQNDAYSIIHLFLRDYDDDKVLSLCSGLPFFWVMTEQDVWNANKRAVLNYAPGQKDLKLVWEIDPKTERIIKMFHSVSDLGSEDALSFSFGGRIRRFYVLNIPNKNIREFQDRVSGFPATPDLKSGAVTPPTMFEGGKGRGKGQFNSPTAIAVAGDGSVFIADTGNGRVEQFSSAGAFEHIIKIGGKDQLQSSEPAGIAVDQAGNIYVADASKHTVEKLGPDGTLIAEWKGPDPGFYGPRRIAIGRDNSIYVVDQGRTRIAKFRPDGQLLTTWGSKGSGDSQFDDPTSVAVDPNTNKVYVADPRNKRIQVFDSDGKFVAKWPVPEWGQSQGYEDLAVDPTTGRLYASSENINSILMFDPDGKRLGSVIPNPPSKLNGPSAVAVAGRKLYVLNSASNRVTAIDL
jgi:DNA-binding beta-propeller fold protein YncE